MGYKPHAPLGPLLIGYDPWRDLPEDHLARFVDSTVDNYASVPESARGPGQPQYDPRPLLKILIYGYSTGVFSSRRLAQNCSESLPYMLLAREDRPCFKTISAARVKYQEELEWLWYCLFDAAIELGVPFVGKIAVDSCKFKADVSCESVIRKELYDSVLEKLRTILAQAEAADSVEDEEGLSVRSRTGVPAGSMHLREILRSFKSDTPVKPADLSQKMLKRVEKAVATLEMAKEEGLSHVSLTDPEARMMALGSRKTISMGHSLEAAAESGLLVHCEVVHQSSDNGRLPTIVESAKRNDPAGVNEAVADSGFFNGSDVLALQDVGVKVVVPDSK